MEAFSEADDSIELEAKRKEDSSWHPCRVSLSSSGDSLIVNFGSKGLEDMLLKKEEVLMHLRFRSMPLQVDDCCRIEEGEHVLAIRKSQFKSLFHDAEVEKVERIRHSKRGCRCTFMIKWLDQNLEGQKLSVPSSSIMKLATKRVSTHPIVHTLLKPEKDTGLSYSSPLLTILEGTDAEMDLNKLLLKQIEQISSLADASEKDFPEDILWRNKAINKGQTPHKPTAESNACVPAVPDHHNHLKRTTQSKRKQLVDMETKDQTGPTSSMQEEFIQNSTHLSPLASRAALASSLLTAKKCLDMDFSSCMSANMFMKSKHSSEILAISIPFVSQPSHVISPLISTQGDVSFKSSSCITTKVCENESKIPEKINCNAEDKTFAPAMVTAEKDTSEVANSSAETMTAKLAISRDKKSSVLVHFNASSTTPIRLTRSTICKGAVIPNDCIQVNVCSDDKKRGMSGNKNRLSHSAVCQENEILGNEEGNNSTHIIDSDSSKGNIAVPESNVDTEKSSTSKKTKATSPRKNADGGRSNQGQKRKTVYPIKQDRRFSPRNFLPRTRSQNKSQPEKYGGTISS
ncbi:uncharacterized protein LOC111311073 isoform X2 [Durio zibethinus]|uniref:Uncharacterized protein LOC111311073 isoform X2 n=1 Tax=Durio zibethinus TaxID=66656 RepID=A0A6P6AMU7_DURZI|nr:uncharacterized protein LOC111311073 isoform X2 [Durio zibethinus]